MVSAALAGVLRIFNEATARSADPAERRQALAIAESLLEEVSLMPFTFCDSEDANVETAASPAGPACCLPMRPAPKPVRPGSPQPRRSTMSTITTVMP